MDKKYFQFNMTMKDRFKIYEKKIIDKLQKR